MRSKFHSTSSTLLTSFLSQPFTPPPLPPPPSLHLQGTEQPPHLPLCPRYRCCSGYKTASWPDPRPNHLVLLQMLPKSDRLRSEASKAATRFLCTTRRQAVLLVKKNCTRFMLLAALHAGWQCAAWWALELRGPACCCWLCYLCSQLPAWSPRLEWCLALAVALLDPALSAHLCSHFKCCDLLLRNVLGA